MKLQDSKVNCGPVALANALEAMGHVRSVDELVKLCKTNATSGTSPRNLVRAIELLKESCGLSEHEIIREGRGASAFGLLWAALGAGRAAVLCVDAGSHYVAAIGCFGQSVIVVDPANDEVVVMCNRDELLEWWEADGRHPFWAVVL
jgi:ABC-type bacteriocin/lantibiotic exporter with double-glycine peptidase domain